MSDTLEQRAREAAKTAPTIAKFAKGVDREAQCLIFLVRYLRKTGGVSPSYEEIGAALNLKSKSQVWAIMHRLEERGLIRIGRGRRRSIEITDPRARIPVYRASDNQIMEYLP